MEVDDRQLVLNCRDGQEDAYRLLLSRYEGYVYSLCYRLTGRREDAVELAQEAWIKVFAGLGDFQLNLPFKPWLRRIALNVCLNFLRRVTPDILSLDHPIGNDFTLGDSLRAPGSDPLTYVQWVETRRMLRDVMGRLPPLFWLVMTLRHQEEMSYQEIATTTGLPLGTVKTYLSRARKMLREWLADAYGWEVNDSGM
ncbi:MAG TPA: sigma-70 family RNA polymerase sigma factor [Spirochaetia bacterium]|nr:sigma-70 family RNA polymerase sigma factor [Spirochaetia bacterium]